MLPTSWKGLQFSISVRIKNSFVFSLKSERSEPPQGQRRSPSYARRQERRKLLKKKTDSFPEDPRESSQTEPDISNNLSLDLNPCPDRCLLGYGENSERESDSDDPVSETGSDASASALAVESQGQEPG